MIVKMIIAVALVIPAYLLVMRYNLHMLQLNGYKNGEHLHWMKKNIRQQWILIFPLAFGAARLFFSSLVMDIVVYAILLSVILVYNVMRRQNVKKKLVYTARVKRLIFTDWLVTAVILAFIILFADGYAWFGAAVILTSLQSIMPVLCNIINRPIEKLIGQHFINDAKRKLKEVPELTIIGVTGSYGKTSVKFYLQTLLQSKYNVLVTPESYNTPMGVVRTIRESLKSTHEIFICEMGARHVGDIKEICDIVHPNHGVITSIGPQHLETFFNMENIQNTKFELADALLPGGMLFLNGDNEYIRQKSEGYRNKTFYYSQQEGNGYCTKDIKVSQLGTEFTVTAPDGTEEKYQMRLIGAHNVINVVGAIAVANQMGILLKDLKVPVRRIQPVEHRMQMRENGNVTIIDDAYNSNPVGSKAAVETLGMFDGLRILITPGMVELGAQEEDFNYKFGTYAAKNCDYILLVGRKHTEPIKKGVLDSGFSEECCKVYEKLEDALSYAYFIKSSAHKYILLENDLPDNY